MRFDVEIADLPPALGFEVPFDPKAVFGKVRAPVRVTINDYTFRTTIAAMGGCALIGLNREVRAGTGVSAGDRVSVELELDDEARTVDVPPDLAAVLDDDLRAFFDSLSYTHRKEYVRWIEEANETRRGKGASRKRSRCCAGRFGLRGSATSGTAGLCYDCFWDRHGLVGSMAIVALSFADLIQSARRRRSYDHATAFAAETGGTAWPG